MRHRPVGPFVPVIAMLLVATTNRPMRARWSQRLRALRPRSIRQWAQLLAITTAVVVILGLPTGRWLGAQWMYRVEMPVATRWFLGSIECNPRGCKEEMAREIEVERIAHPPPTWWAYLWRTGDTQAWLDGYPGYMDFDSMWGTRDPVP